MTKDEPTRTSPTSETGASSAATTLLSATGNADILSQEARKKVDALKQRMGDRHAAIRAHQASTNRGRSSKYRGVCLDKRREKWRATINAPGGPYYGINLGYFDNETDAARAYNAAAEYIFREHAMLNDLST